MVQKKSVRSANFIDECIGKKIRDQRQALGLSQSSLADAIGITFQQIQKYEKGTNRVTVSRLIELSKVLDIHICYFLEDLAKKAPKKVSK